MQNARIAVYLTQYQAAQLYSFRLGDENAASADTISRWECDAALPTPEQVSLLEEVYHKPGLWDDWMRQQYPSYQKRIPKRAAVTDPTLAVVQAGWEMQDVAEVAQPLSRDLLDGKLDDPNLKRQYIAQANQALSALSAALTLLGKEDGT